MNLAEKLVKLRKGLDYFQKSADSYNYKYVPGVDILVKARPIMDELGLLLKTEVISFAFDLSEPKKQTVCCDMMMTWIDAESGEKMDTRFAAFGQQDDLSKAFGSALTYSERYFLMKFFNIPTDKDDPDRFRKQHGLETDEEKANALASKDQVDKMFSVGKQCGFTGAEMRNACVKVLNKDDSKTLTVGDCDTLEKYFDDNIKAGQETKPYSQRHRAGIQSLLTLAGLDEKEELAKRTQDGSSHWNRLMTPAGETWLKELQEIKRSQDEAEPRQVEDEIPMITPGQTNILAMWDISREESEEMLQKYFGTSELRDLTENQANQLIEYKDTGIAPS